MLPIALQAHFNTDNAFKTGFVPCFIAKNLFLQIDRIILKVKTGTKGCTSCYIKTV